MPTVSDLISIQLSIDASGVVSGGDAATHEIERVKARIKQQADDVERLLKSIGEDVNTALHYVAGLMGVVLSFEGFRRLVVDFSTAGTSLGRFSEAVEVAAGRVGALEQAFERTGGRADDVKPLLAAMRSDITQAQGGMQPAKWLSSIGLTPIGMGALEAVNLGPEKAIREIARRAQAAHLTPTQLKALLPGLPLSLESAAVLTTPGLLEKQLSGVAEKGTAQTPEQIAAAERLKEKVATLQQLSDATLRDLITLTEPFLSTVLDWVKTALEWIDGMQRRLIGSSSAGVGAPTSPVPVSSGARRGMGTPTTPYSPSRPSERPPSPESVLRTPAATAPGSVSAAGGGPPSAFIVHHTGGRGDVAGVQRTLQERGLGVQYVMDRDGRIYQIGGPGASHMMTGWGAGAGLSNRNTVGMEVIAKDDKDVTPAQVEAARRFIGEKYPNTPVFGHGEVNPGHKEADEGMTIVGAIRRQRQGSATGAVRGSTFNDVTTASGRSAATTRGIAIPSGGKMGDLYEITTPDGRKFIAPLIDRGPAAWTGRGVDISEELAREMGYSTRNFPTDSMFKVSPYGPKAGINIPNVVTGSTAAAAAPGPENKVINNETSAVVNHVTVHTNAMDASGIANDVKKEVGRALDLGAAP